jgi:hypothetical protein
MSENEFSFKDLYDKFEKESEIHVLQAGSHTLRVTGCSPKGKGLMPIYTPVEGPDAGKRVMCGVMSPGDSDAGRVAFMQRLVKFGLSKEFFSQEPSLKEISAALVGRVITGEITIEPWNGEPRNKLGFGIKLVSAPPLPAVAGIPSIPGINTAPPVEGGGGGGGSSHPTEAPEAASVPPGAAPPVASDDEDPGF